MASGVRRRQWLLVGVVGVAVLAGVVGFVAGRQISSPADVAAGVEAPEASLITVPVELRELASTVVSRGDVRLEGSVDVEIDSSVAGEAGGVAVVTGLTVGEGEVVDEGDVLIEVAERPVFALVGELPMFRNLGPGSQGDDVTQLQEALVRLGFDVLVDGTYSESTERAIEQLYLEAGYRALGLSDVEQAELDAARETLAAAESQVVSAQSALSSLSKPPPRSTVLGADASRDDAEAGVGLAKAARKEANTAARQAVADAVVERTGADAEAALVADRLAQANAGTHPDTGLAPTADELAELAAESTAAAEVAVAADVGVKAAEAVRERTKAEQRQFVAGAKTSLEIARAQYTELVAAPDSADAVRAVSDAGAARDEAAAEVASIEQRTGVRLPRGEIVFFDVMPRRVQRLSVERGDVLAGPAMTVSGAELTIDSSVPASDRSLLSEGDTATLDDESLGIRFEATIVEIADQPGGRVSDGRFYMRLVPVDDPEGDIAGLNLRITIPITSTGGEVLTVPLAALAAGGDGSVRIEIEDEANPGVTRTVVVTTGLETTGFVEISAPDDSVAAGDRVVVGTG